MPFTCSICGEESTRICARCTKDACDNHLCEKCMKCSDCCECEVKLSAPARMMVHAPNTAVETAIPDPEPDPEPPIPGPGPDPVPESEGPAPIAP